MNENLLRLVNWFGSQQAIADQLGVTAGAVSQWFSEGEVPPRRALEIEAITKGEIVAAGLVKGIVEQ